MGEMPVGDEGIGDPREGPGLGTVKVDMVSVAVIAGVGGRQCGGPVHIFKKVHGDRRVHGGQFDA